MGKEETNITKSIRDYLKIMHIFHWKQWQGIGSSPGISDIIGIYKGRPLAIEVKTLRGKVTDDQQNFLDNFKDAGGIAIVARSVDDVIYGLKAADKVNYPD